MLQTVKWINNFTSTLLNWEPKGIITHHCYLCVDVISRSQIFRRNLPITNAETPSWKAMLPAILVIFGVENFLFMFFRRNMALPLFLTVAVFATHPAMEVYLLIQPKGKLQGSRTCKSKNLICTEPNLQLSRSECVERAWVYLLAPPQKPHKHISRRALLPTSK